MRTKLALSLLIVSGATSAQNWALLNPAYKYNYSNDGSDTISNQIFITHIDTLGLDSFRYELNTVGVICPGCSPDHTSPCWFGPTTDLVRDKGTQALGSVLVNYGTVAHLVYAEDTLQLEPLGAVGSSWVGPDGISGSIFSAIAADVLGASDSVKWIAFSNGDTLAISREHGVVFVNRSGNGRYDLLGIDGQIQEGLHFPRVIDLFDYQVGDVLQYRDNSTFQSSFCVHFVEGRTRYEVVSRSDEEAITTYTLERTFYSDEESYYPQWWTPCGELHSEGQEQVSLVVEHDRFAEGKFFNSGLHGALYPASLDSVFQEPVSNGLLTSLSAHVDSIGRYVIEPGIIYSAGWEASLLCQSNEDPQLLFPNSDGNYFFSYTEGIGLTYLDYFSFESGATRVLEGYILGGQQWGTVWSNSIILGAVEHSVEKAPLFPNPATDFLYLNNTTAGVQCTIHDPQGRVVRRALITTLSERLDVQGLSPGAYVVTLEGSAPGQLIIQR